MALFDFERFTPNTAQSFSADPSAVHKGLYYLCARSLAPTRRVADAYSDASSREELARDRQLFEDLVNLGSSHGPQ